MALVHWPNIRIIEPERPAFQPTARVEVGDCHRAEGLGRAEHAQHNLIFPTPTDNTAGTLGHMPDESQYEPTEYDRFRDLASKLVKVPKDELDKARDRDKAAKP